MFYIYWMNQYNRDWIGDEGFATRIEAEQFLEEQGYVFKGGWFRRKPIGWEGETKAMVGVLTLYTKGG